MQQTVIDIASWQVTEPEIMDTDKYLSGANAPEIEEDIRLCITSGARDMIINCSKLSYMTSAGMRAFLTVARLMQDVGGKLSVKGLKGQPREMFYACGMDSLIQPTDAVANLSIAKAA
jgi:stage II sporulation protein AA (anti-sigma F factor antagonist)